LKEKPNYLKTKEELLGAIKDMKQQKGPILLLVKIKKNPYSDLKRPDKPPKE